MAYHTNSKLKDSNTKIVVCFFLSKQRFIPSATANAVFSSLEKFLGFVFCLCLISKGSGFYSWRFLLFLLFMNILHCYCFPFVHNFICHKWMLFDTCCLKCVLPPLICWLDKYFLKCCKLLFLFAVVSMIKWIMKQAHDSKIIMLLPVSVLFNKNRCCRNKNFRIFGFLQSIHR